VISTRSPQLETLIKFEPSWNAVVFPAINCCYSIGAGSAPEIGMDDNTSATSVEIPSDIAGDIVYDWIRPAFLEECTVRCAQRFGNSTAVIMFAQQLYYRAVCVVRSMSGSWFDLNPERERMLVGSAMFFMYNNRWASIWLPGSNWCGQCLYNVAPYASIRCGCALAGDWLASP
jgi:hypothetical protein